MGNKQSSEEERSLPPAPPPRPKHLLWGCETAEEHYAAVEEACRVAAKCHGSEGLEKFGFDYRMVHSQPCDCGAHYSDLDVESLSNASDTDYDFNDMESTEFMIPLGESLKEYLPKEGGGVFEMERSTSSLSGEQQHIQNREPIRKSQSSVSLFSLSTHISMGSNSVDASSSSDLGPPMHINGHSNHKKDDNHETCAIRLFHVASGSLVTEKNHQTFVAHGNMYDEVARLCMEFAQDLMISEGDLEWTTLSTNPKIGALVSRNRSRTKTLLLVTGKGKVGAGIFSRRLLMTLGIEPATALPFVREATRRNMNVVVLDPNCHGTQSAMQVVETSLERLFSEFNHEFYLLAHSMAGSQLVRFLLNKASPLDENHATDNPSETASTVDACVEQFKAVAFTDSNHNINWVKKYPSISNFLVGPRSLYIKSHKVHQDAKALGETHHDCQYWRHRFGTIKTLWAGTKEHALTNYTARFHIWRHFDSFLEDDDDNEDSLASY